MPPDASGASSFYAVLTQAVADIVEHGFDNEARVAMWMDRLKSAAEAEMLPPEKMAALLRSSLGTIYTRLVEKGAVLERHPGIGRFTLARLKPKLRMELDRRIAASANLIKLNRAESIEKTMRRFQGWATSIPTGGTAVAKRVEVKAEVRRSLASLPYHERVVIIDQGHKLTASINAVIARDGDSIAAKWRHVHQAGYNGRPDHEARDGKIYAARDSWATQQGLISKGAGWSDDIDQPSEFPMCRCWWVHLYNLRDLPSDMLTAKGRAALKDIRIVA